MPLAALSSSPLPAAAAAAAAGAFEEEEEAEEVEGAGVLCGWELPLALVLLPLAGGITGALLGTITCRQSTKSSKPPPSMAHLRLMP